MPVRNTHQHTAILLYYLIHSYVRCVPRFAVSTTLRNGSDLHYDIPVMLCWELQLVAGSTISFQQQPSKCRSQKQQMPGP